MWVLVPVAVFSLHSIQHSKSMGYIQRQREAEKQKQSSEEAELWSQRTTSYRGQSDLDFTLIHRILPSSQTLGLTVPKADRQHISDLGSDSILGLYSAWPFTQTVYKNIVGCSNALHWKTEVRVRCVNTSDYESFGEKGVFVKQPRP